MKYLLFYKPWSKCCSKIKEDLDESESEIILLDSLVHLEFHFGVEFWLGFHDFDCDESIFLMEIFGDIDRGKPSRLEFPLDFIAIFEDVSNWI